MDYEKLLNNCGSCDEGDAQPEEEKKDEETEAAETPDEETVESAQ